MKKQFKLIKDKNSFQIHREKKSILEKHDDEGNKFLEIEGYASTKDKDRGHDIVEPKAFENALSTYMTNPIVLLQHKHDKPIGTVTEASIDDKGLYIKAQITQDIDGCMSAIKNGVLRTFSIGYGLKEGDYEINEYINDEGNADYETTIKNLELYEISVVSVPMNAYALMKSIEDCFEVKEIEDEENDETLSGNINFEGFDKEEAKNDENEEKDKTESNEEVENENNEENEGEKSIDDGSENETAEEKNNEGTNIQDEEENNVGGADETMESEKSENEEKEEENDEEKVEDEVEEEVVDEEENKEEVADEKAIEVKEEATETNEAVENTEINEEADVEKVSENDSESESNADEKSSIETKSIDESSEKSFRISEKEIDAMIEKAVESKLVEHQKQVNDLKQELDRVKEVLKTSIQVIKEMDGAVRNTVIKTGATYSQVAKRKSAYSDVIEKAQSSL